MQFASGAGANLMEVVHYFGRPDAPGHAESASEFDFFMEDRIGIEKSVTAGSQVEFYSKLAADRGPRNSQRIYAVLLETGKGIELGHSQLA
jgi:hypothetical protein